MRVQRPLPDEFKQLDSEIGQCHRCARLVEWREKVAREKRASYRDQQYWGRGVPGFGDTEASLMVVGLAPAAHGANRTGRMFTGDRSGDWLFRAMYRAGYANQPESDALGDGLELDGAWVTAPVRCAPPQNRPTASELDSCRPFLERELAMLNRLKVVIALGAVGYRAMAVHFGLRPRPTFGHGVEVRLETGLVLLASYHVSQQNTFTGRLTEPMLDEIFSRARQLSDA